VQRTSHIKAPLDTVSKDAYIETYTDMSKPLTWEEGGCVACPAAGNMASEEREAPPPCASAWQIAGDGGWTEERERRGVGRGRSASITEGRFFL